MRFRTIVHTGVAVSLLLCPQQLVAQTPSSAASRSVVLVLKKKISKPGISAVVRRTPGALVPDLIAFNESDFTPELLGLTLMSLDAARRSDPGMTRGKSEIQFRSRQSLPRLEGSWRDTVLAIAARLAAATPGDASLHGVTKKDRWVAVAIPVPPECRLCERLSAREP